MYWFITVPADILVPNGARASTNPLMTMTIWWHAIHVTSSKFSVLTTYPSPGISMINWSISWSMAAPMSPPNPSLPYTQPACQGWSAACRLMAALIYLGWYASWNKWASVNTICNDVLNIYLMHAEMLSVCLMTQYLIPGSNIKYNKQRVLMHRHQGLNVRHGLCHIYMRYLYIYELFIAFVCFVVCSLL